MAPYLNHLLGPLACHGTRHAVSVLRSVTRADGSACLDFCMYGEMDTFGYADVNTRSTLTLILAYPLLVSTFSVAV